MAKPLGFTGSQMGLIHLGGPRRTDIHGNNSDICGYILRYRRDVTTASDLAVQLEPLLGRWAKYVFSTGLFAAGISSAITAPSGCSITQQQASWDGRETCTHGVSG